MFALRVSAFAVARFAVRLHGRSRGLSDAPGPANPGDPGGGAPSPTPGSPAPQPTAGGTTPGVPALRRPAEPRPPPAGTTPGTPGTPPATPASSCTSPGTNTGAGVLRRLSGLEYQLTLQDLFALPEPPSVEGIPPDTDKDGFRTFAEVQTVSPQHVRAYLVVGVHQLGAAVPVEVEDRQPALAALRRGLPARRPRVLRRARPRSPAGRRTAACSRGRRRSACRARRRRTPCARRRRRRHRPAAHSARPSVGMLYRGAVDRLELTAPPGPITSSSAESTAAGKLVGQSPRLAMPMNVPAKSSSLSQRMSEPLSEVVLSLKVVLIRSQVKIPWG